MSEPTAAQVIAAAAGAFKLEYVPSWLRSRNKMLDNRSPAELIDAGEGQRVLDLIDFLASANAAYLAAAPAAEPATRPDGR